MPRVQRTDVHRPSAIDPSQYRFVAFDYLRDVAATDRPIDLTRCSWLQAEREKIRLDMVRTGGGMSDHTHGGNCMVCGNANALYTAMFHHAPSNQYLRMGCDCAANVEASLDHAAFERFRHRVGRWIERQDRIPACQAALRERGLDALVPLVAMDALEPTNTDNNRNIAHSIVRGYLRYGSLTDAQWRYLAVLRDRIVGAPTADTAAPTTHRPNRFGGQCADCHQPVEAMAGRLESQAGRWVVRHLEGQCPQRPAPAAAASVGELTGINELFDRAAQHLQRPAIVIEVPHLGAIRVWRNGANDRAPGTLTVVREQQGSDGRRPYRGRVQTDGRFTPGRDLTPEAAAAIIARLQEFAREPARIAGEYGRLHGRCCFCRLPLTDERSTAVGYGAICAGHYGLPWGDRPAAFAAPVTPAPTPRQQQAARDYIARHPHPFVGAARRPNPTADAVSTEQLDLNFDPAAARAQHIAEGQECPGCEGRLVRRNQSNNFVCAECGVQWEPRS